MTNKAQKKGQKREYQKRVKSAAKQHKTQTIKGTDIGKTLNAI
jgi:ERCC4-related helicase